MSDSPALLILHPRSSRQLRQLIGLAFLAAALALLLIAIFLTEHGGGDRPGWPVTLAFVGVALGWGVLARNWRRYLLRAPPYSLAFGLDRQVQITRCAGASPQAFMLGSVVLGEQLLAMTLVGAAGPARAQTVHWLSGRDALDDDSWRQLRSWVIWTKRKS